jgi:hypothetical protein
VGLKRKKRVQLTRQEAFLSPSDISQEALLDLLPPVRLPALPIFGGLIYGLQLVTDRRTKSFQGTNSRTLKIETPQCLKLSEA